MLGTTHLPTTNYLPSRLIRCTPSLSWRKPLPVGRCVMKWNWLESVSLCGGLASRCGSHSACSLSSTVSCISQGAPGSPHCPVPESSRSKAFWVCRQEHTDRAQLPKLACPGRIARGRRCWAKTRRDPGGHERHLQFSEGLKKKKNVFWVVPKGEPRAGTAAH